MNEITTTGLGIIILFFRSSGRRTIQRSEHYNSSDLLPQSLFTNVARMCVRHALYCISLSLPQIKQNYVMTRRVDYRYAKNIQR
jgi:glyoxylate carboligase